VGAGKLVGIKAAEAMKRLSRNDSKGFHVPREAPSANPPKRKSELGLLVRRPLWTPAGADKQRPYTIQWNHE
jgi:hypothetical protein